MTLELYHHNASVCAAKIRVALAEKNLDWESRLLALDGDQFAPGYLALNPNAVVPTLVHHGKPIIESTVILEYLEDAFPERSLRPSDPHDLAQARLVMSRLDFGGASIHYAASVITYAIANRHRLIEQAGGLEPEPLIAAIDRNMNPKSRRWLEDVVFKGVHAPAFGKAIRNFDTLLDDFESRLGKTEWLTGNRYSISDVSFTPYMIRLDLLQTDFLWHDRPHVAAWYTRLKARRSASAVLDVYHPSSIANLTNRGREVREEVRSILDQHRNDNGQRL